MEKDRRAVAKDRGSKDTAESAESMDIEATNAEAKTTIKTEKTTIKEGKEERKEQKEKERDLQATTMDIATNAINEDTLQSIVVKAGGMLTK